MQSSTPPVLIDVREQSEYELCKIPGSKLVPLGALPTQTGQIPKDQTVVIHCHHGGRSARAVALLQQQGYTNIFNLTGGIHAWSERIDPAVKTYG